MSSHDRFKGKTAIVTGAGSGIGKATAIRLATEGAKVIASDVVADRLDALKREHEQLDFTTVVGDVSKQESVDELVRAAGGSVDCLANVAGIMDSFLPPAEVDDATWERVMNVNLNGTMRLTRAVLPGMIEKGSGTIVNVSSEAGFRASAAGVAYTTSKHAVVGFTKSVAFFYLPKGIRCNSVAPGAVATNIEAPFKSEWGKERSQPFMQIIPGVAQPEQLAAAITWLLSDDSSNVNGVVLPVDTGWSTI